MILPVYVVGCPLLRRKAGPVEEGMEGLDTLIADMWDTMYKIDGVGLAAPQIGKSLRIFVIDASPYAEEDPALVDFKQVFINAEILDYSGDPYPFQEGCLSVPGIHEEVVRPAEVTIRYQDETFQTFEQHFSGVAARVIQHEYDHLEGKLFIDKLNPLKRRLLASQIDRIGKGKSDVAYRVVLPSNKRR